ncbi:MAG: hypothetical protein HY812_06935 [Planctomycetes bacterium]|nr:hypothetical protein [Planctomycetota bacterium]
MTSTVLAGLRLSAWTLVLILLPGVSALGQVSFVKSTIDVNAGDLKMVGDIDLDGTVDVVLGGSPGENLNWYHYPSWTRTVLAVPVTEYTTDGELGDVDGDGDLDIVTPDGASGTNLQWFENPVRTAGGPGGDPFQPAQWTQHVLGAIGSWGKDIELADFDKNGLLDVATRTNGGAMIFFQTAPGTWLKVALSIVKLGYEGMGSGDVDDDGDADLVFCGSWHQNPGGSAARTGAAWKEFFINVSGVVSNTFKALVADVDQDGVADVLFTSSEATAAVIWCEPVAGDPMDVWVTRTIAPSLEKAHTLLAGDMDLDGDVDVVVGQMHTSLAKELIIFMNQDGFGLSWSKVVIDSGSGVHNGRLVDIGADGDLDVVGANWTGHPPLHYWENLIPQDHLLLDIGPVVGGEQTLLRTTNCTAGVPAFLVATFYPLLSPYYFAPLGVTLELGLPFFLLGMPAVGQNGVADLAVQVPAGLPPATFWVQTLQAGRTSNVEVVQIP